MTGGMLGRRARFAASGFVIATAFVPGIFSMPSAPRWWAMAILLPVCCEIDPRHIPWPIALGLAWAGAGAFFAPMPYEAALDVYLLVLTALWLAGAASAPGLAKAGLTGFGWGMGVSAVLAVGQQFFGVGIVPHSEASGLFLNTEVYAEAAAPVLAWAIWSARWHIAAFCAVPLVLCNSRVAVAAAAVGLAWSLTPRWRWALLALFVIAGVASIFALGTYKASTGMSRLVIWGMAIEAIEPLGKGIGWWATTFTGRTLEYAHSDVLQILVELGIGAVPMLVFAALLLRDARVAGRALGAAFATVCFEALVSFPLHTPAGAFLFAVLAGSMVCARDGVCAGTVSRGEQFVRGLFRPSGAFAGAMVRAGLDRARAVSVGSKPDAADLGRGARRGGADGGAMMLRGGAI